MFCRNCGKSLSDTAAFCNHCGTTIRVSEQQDSSFPKAEYVPLAYTQPESKYEPRPYTPYSPQNNYLGNSPSSPTDSFPIEWNKLKEIYPEAEIKEYADYERFSNGNWDMDGLKEDLRVMMERTGKKPTGKASKK